MTGLALLAIPTPSATPIPVFGSGVIGFSFLLSTIIWAPVVWAPDSLTGPWGPAAAGRPFPDALTGGDRSSRRSVRCGHGVRCGSSALAAHWSRYFPGSWPRRLPAITLRSFLFCGV